MTIQEKSKRLRELREKISNHPEPWFAYQHNVVSGFVTEHDSGGVTYSGSQVCETREFGKNDDDGTWERDEHVAAFIAAAANDLPAILDRLERVEKALGKAFQFAEHIARNSPVANAQEHARFTLEQMDAALAGEGER